MRNTEIIAETVEYNLRGTGEYDPTDKYKVGSNIVIRLRMVSRIKEPVVIVGNVSSYRFEQPVR